MRMQRIIMPAIASICTLGSATAGELTGAEIKDLISGKSVYLELTTGSTATPGRGVIYYAPDGNALYKTAMGVMWHGTWAIKDNTACIDWEERPNNPCAKYDKQGDNISIINVETGQTRGKVLKVAPGNAERLAP
jgi:hypothetical protein